MRRLTCQVLTVVAGITIAQPLHGQELDVLELDDFMDPRVLQYPEASGGAFRFLASRVYVGAADHHNFRGEFLPSRVHFGRLATAFYSGRWQFTAKLTDYDTRTRREPPYFRSRLQVARYLGGTEAVAPVRAQFSWSFSESRTVGSQDEFAVDLSTMVTVAPLPGPIRTGIVYSQDPSSNRHFTSASFQVPVRQWRGGSSISVGASIARDRSSDPELVDSSGNIFKTVLALSIRIPGTETYVYGAYSPAYRRGLEKWNHEITVLLDAGVLAKLFK